MILEISYIQVAKDNLVPFELAVEKAIDDIISTSKGFIDFKMCRGLEEETTYVFMVWWETLEDHIIGFRESELFQKWRNIIDPYFEKPPIFAGHWEAETK